MRRLDFLLIFRRTNDTTEMTQAICGPLETVCDNCAAFLGINLRKKLMHKTGCAYVSNNAYEEAHSKELKLLCPLTVIRCWS